MANAGKTSSERPEDNRKEIENLRVEFSKNGSSRVDMNDDKVLETSLNNWNRKDLQTILREKKAMFKSKFRKKELFECLLLTILKKRYDSKMLIDSITPCVIKIQCNFRGWRVRNNIRSRGMAVFARNICTNDIDPITLTNLYDISIESFISYTGSDNKIYGFDIRSLKQMFDHGQQRNPFNREEFPRQLYVVCFRLWNTLIRSPKFRGNDSKSDFSNHGVNIDRKAFQIFHDAFLLTGIDVNHRWFVELDRHQSMELYAILHDQWLRLPTECRRRFNTDNSRWFRQYNDVYVTQIYNRHKVQLCLLAEFEKMMGLPTDRGDKETLTLWILMALTKISEPASQEMQQLW